MPTTDDVARIARDICGRFKRGDRGGVQIGQIHFELTDQGYCSEFVRECCEAAAGTPDHGELSYHYFGGTAKETEAKLRARGTGITQDEAVPGDIICLNAKTGQYGHIAIWLGGGQVAENTSSQERGPGFVISRMDVIGWDRVTGFYHLPEFDRPVEAVGPARLVVLLPGSDRNAQPLFHEGTHYLSVRDVGRMFGVDVIDRRATDGKIYLRAPGEAGG